MIDALYISASGLRSEQKLIDVISHNVANMQTPGFKRSRVNFVDVASAAVGAQAGQSDAMRGAGTRIASLSQSFAPGEMRQTRDPLDLAIEGAGFFEVQALDGSVAYTRDGQFRLDTEGNIVTQGGLPLARGVQVPLEATDLRVGADGQVSVQMPGDTERTVLGAIELTTFAAEDGLQSIGDNLFRATDASGAASYGAPGATGFGRIEQGFVELSNVEMIDEMSALVLAQRAYQLNARVLQAADQVLETINNLRR